MQSDAAGDDGSDLEELGANRPALFGRPVGSLQTKAVQAVHQDVGEGAHDETVLVWPPTVAGGAVGEEVDSVVRSLEKAGGKINSIPKDSEWGRRAVMKDLDGHSVELITLVIPEAAL